MRLFRGTVVDTPADPFAGGGLRVEQDGGLLVDDNGVVVARGAYDVLRGEHPAADLEDLRGGLLLPGLVDSHVHFPQVRMIGSLGMPLLDWLRHSALPEEARLADQAYATQVAREFLGGLVAAGTTSALVFGAHFAAAVDVLFAEAARVGLRVTSGLVVSDRLLRPDLLVSGETAYARGRELADRWHGAGRSRYAVTPRFSLSCTEELLESCSALLSDVPGALMTSHINENRTELATVRGLFAGCADYLATYDEHGLVGPQSVFAHNVHATPGELAVLAAQGASVAHCPTSNAALGSGLFPLREHVGAGVRVAVGSDVGAGTGFCLFKECLQAYFVQQLLGEQGFPLTATHLLYLATRAGAEALHRDDVGDFDAGHQFDAVHVRPAPGTTLDVGLRHARDAEDALAKVFALGTPADVVGVWVGGERIDVSALTQRVDVAFLPPYSDPR